MSRFEDVEAIRRLKHEYCYAIDSGDYEEWVALFTDNGRFVRGGEETFEGRDELLGFATEVFDDAFDRSAHVVTNPIVDVAADGESAIGRWYLILCYETPEGDVGWTQARYDDEYRRVDGEWRIAEAAVSYGVQFQG